MPFDMCVVNDLDRIREVGDIIDRLPRLGVRAAYFKQAIRHKLIEHRDYIVLHGGDMRWRWEQSAALRELRSTKADNV
jgi:xylulose-5-phosphate/fructose-6-phosphate phosphoketolase